MAQFLTLKQNKFGKWLVFGNDCCRSLVAEVHIFGCMVELAWIESTEWIVDYETNEAVRHVYYYATDHFDDFSKLVAHIDGINADHSGVDIDVAAGMRAIADAIEGMIADH